MQKTDDRMGGGGREVCGGQEEEEIESSFGISCVRCL